MEIILNAMTAQKNEIIATQQQKISHLEHTLQIIACENNWLREQLKLNKSTLYAPSTETSHAFNMALFDATTADEVMVTEEKNAVGEVTHTGHRPGSTPKKGRQIDTAKLPRERRVHDLTPEEKICSCGCELEKIGEDVSEQLEHIPAVIKVIEHVQIKYACRQCETISAGKKPEQPMAKCLASTSLITEVIIKKYDYHIPLYRQSLILAQEGIDIPDNTLGNWVMGAAQGLSPLHQAFWEQVEKVRLLQVDETPVKILEPDKKGYMWAYHSVDKGNRFIVFEFDLSRGSAVVNERLKNFKGILQTDAYSGYTFQRARSDIVAVGCWDHARRKFTDAIKVANNNKSGLAGKAVHLMAKFYKIEKDYKQASVEERYRARQQYTKPLLTELYELMDQANAPPESLLGKAIVYLQNNKPYLIKYVEYGDVAISNCLVENQIRPFAVGRRNWLFVGNEVSANKSALLYSLIQTAKMNNIHPGKYLNYVLSQVHAVRRGDVDPVSLLPQFINKNLL